MVPGAGVEPARSFLRGIFIPTTTFVAETTLFFWGLDFLFSISQNDLGGSRQVSTLSEQTYHSA